MIIKCFTHIKFFIKWSHWMAQFCCENMILFMLRKCSAFSRYLYFLYTSWTSKFFWYLAFRYVMLIFHIFFFFIMPYGFFLSSYLFLTAYLFLFGEPWYVSFLACNSLCHFAEFLLAFFDEYSNFHLKVLCQWVCTVVNWS